MSECNETLADIVAEMRRGTKLPGYWRMMIYWLAAATLTACVTYTGGAK